MAAVNGTKTTAKGKQVVINARGKKIYGVLDEDITLNLSSEFEQFLPSIPGTAFITKLGNLTKSIGVNFSGKTKHMGFQSWKSSAPLQFTAQLGFYATTNPKREVYDPIMALSKLALPRLGTGGIMIPPGPSFTETFRDADGNKVTNKKKQADATKQIDVAGEANNTISMTIGVVLHLSKVIIHKAEPTFSSEVAMYDRKLYPLWGKVSLDVTSIVSAYAEMLDVVNKPA